MIPSFIIAGDTSKFTWEDPTYLPDSYTATLYLNGPSTLNSTASASGTRFLFTIPAIQTRLLIPGSYSYSLRLTSGTEAYTVESGALTIRPNPATLTATVPLPQRMITLIEAALTNQLTDGEAIEAMSLGGRSLTLMSRKELLDERGYWYRELNKLSGKTNIINSIRLSVGRL